MKNVFHNKIEFIFVIHFAIRLEWIRSHFWANTRLNARLNRTILLNDIILFDVICGVFIDCISEYLNKRQPMLNLNAKHKSDGSEWLIAEIDCNFKAIQLKEEYLSSDSLLFTALTPSYT